MEYIIIIIIIISLSKFILALWQLSEKFFNLFEAFVLQRIEMSNLLFKIVGVLLLLRYLLEIEHIHLELHELSILDIALQANEIILHILCEIRGILNFVECTNDIPNFRLLPVVPFNESFKMPSINYHLQVILKFCFGSDPIILSKDIAHNSNQHVH